MKKIKIAHINNISQLSGSQLISISILKMLDSSIYEKYIVCGRDELNYNIFKSTCDKYDINLIIIENQVRDISFLDFQYFLKLISTIRKYKFEIVHTNSSKPGLFGRIAAKVCFVPLVLHTVHGISFHKGQPLLKRIVFYLLEILGAIFSDKIILVNNYYKKYFKLFNKKVEVIYNGLLFQDCPIDIIRPVSNKKRILFLSRFEAQKDPISLLKAICFIRTYHFHLYNNLLVRMVGDGDLFNVCNQFIIDNELLDVVQLMPWSDNKWDIYKQTDIFCIPSIHEAFGLVFLEAGFMEIPVVSTNVEGIPEVVLDGFTGLLSAPNDSLSLAKNLVELLEDDKKSYQLGINARFRILKQFDFNNSIERYIALYQIK